MSTEPNSLTEQEAGGPGGLGGLRYNAPSPPSREALISAAVSRAPQIKETTLMAINRIFLGRLWYLKLSAAAMMLCAVFAAVLLFPRETSLAQESPGYVLSYDLGAAATPEQGAELHSSLEPQVAPFHDALKAFLGKKKEAAKAAGAEYNSKASIRMMNENGKLTMVVGLAGADQALMEELRDALGAAVPGLPQPQIQDATWFSHGELDPACEGGLRVVLNGHVFSFGPGFTSEEVESTLNAWLKENKPGATAKVTIDKTSGGEGEQNIQVKVEVSGGDEETAGESAPK
jgi:hypothetical protein